MLQKGRQGTTHTGDQDMETFLQMRDRLMDVHGWCVRVATIAARYYLGIESINDLQHRTQEHPCVGHILSKPTLSLLEANQIRMWR